MCACDCDCACACACVPVPVCRCRCLVSVSARQCFCLSVRAPSLSYTHLPRYNARNILTLWGPTGQINDYAKKEWGGLVRDYYKQR